MDNTQDFVRERIRIGDFEIEVEGHPTYVKQRILEYLQMAKKLQSEEATITPQQLAIMMPNAEVQESKNGTHTIRETEQVIDAPVRDFRLDDLIKFYLEKSPNSQADTVLVVTYFYKEYLNKEELTLEDYDQAFKTLKKAAVKPPSNMKSSVRNVVDRTDYMFNPERGTFALTLQGEKYVRSMNQET